MDVLMGVTLSVFLVLVLVNFVGDVMRYSQFIARHQQLRSDVFALMNSTLPKLIREAASIDYSNSHEHQLSLFMDKQETRRVTISLQPEIFDSREDLSQLVLREGDQIVVLHSSQSFIEDFSVHYASDPTVNGLERLQDERARQPMVQYSLQARAQRLGGSRERKAFVFFDDPRIAYQAVSTLRNYSFSNLYHPSSL